VFTSVLPLSFKLDEFEAEYGDDEGDIE